MKGVETLQVEVEKARDEWRSYLSVLQTHKEQVYRDLASVYGHMKQGKAVLDVFHAFQETGLRKDGWPKLAILRADYKEVWFQRVQGGGGIFRGSNPRDWNSRSRPGRQRFRSRKEDVAVPRGTFRNWTSQEMRWNADLAKSQAPFIPPKFIPDSGFQNYYLLWEAESWSYVRPPKDPMLMRRISPNMFVVLASWDLSPLEISVLKGRIA